MDRDNPVVVLEDRLARLRFYGQPREVLTAASGVEGLTQARHAHPAAITLDVMMPDIDGWTVLWRR